MSADPDKPDNSGKIRSGADTVIRGASEFIDETIRELCVECRATPIKVERVSAT